MEEQNKSRIGIVILFILSFVFIMFLPNIRSTIRIKQYEKEQKEELDRKQEEESQKAKHTTLNTIICSIDDTSYSLQYKSSGLQKFIKVESKEIESDKKDELLKECEKEQEENAKGIETKCEVNNKVLTKSVTYNFVQMDEKYRKDNIFDYKYNESIEKIKSSLVSKGYTCG